MKRTLQLPLVGILAFVLGMGADHLLLRKQTTVGGDKVDRGHAGSSILDDVSVERRDSNKKTSPAAKGLAGGGGGVTAAELLDMIGSPMGQRMTSAVEVYQRLSSMSAESLQALALELERSPWAGGLWSFPTFDAFRMALQQG